MNKQVKRSIIGGIIFFIEWAILAGISIAHDNGAFEAWYRNVFRHPRLIGIVCGFLMIMVLLLLCKPKKPIDIFFALAPVLACNLVVNGIRSRIYHSKVEDMYLGTELGFWADRLMFIFFYMAVATAVVLAVIMFAETTPERKKAVFSGVICTVFLWAFSEGFDRLQDYLYVAFDIDILEPLYGRGGVLYLIFIGVLLALIMFVVLKKLRLIESFSKLVLFGVSALVANFLITEAYDRINGWDKVDGGLGIVIMGFYLACALAILCVIMAIDMAIVHKRKKAIKEKI